MAITEYQRQIIDLIPNQPPEEVLQYAKKKNILNRHAIVYRSPAGKKNVVQCTCTACGGSFEAVKGNFDTVEGCRYFSGPTFGFYIESEFFRSRSSMMCPLCGEAVTVYHCSEISSEGDCLISDVLVQLTTVDGHSAAVSWIWRKMIHKDGTTRTIISPFEAYVFVKKKCYRYSGWMRIYYRTLYTSKFDCCGCCMDELGEIARDQVAPFKKTVWDGTELENAKMDRYLNESVPTQCYPITYLRSFQQHPQVENLIMQGFSRMYNQIIYANAYSIYGYMRPKIPQRGICWRGRRPADILGLTTEEFRSARAEKWSLDELELVRAAKDGGIHINVVEMRNAKLDHYVVKEFLKLGADPIRAAQYVQKQEEKLHNGASVSMLTDYYRLCRTHEIKLNARVMWPADLRREHDRLVFLSNQKRIDASAEGAKKYLQQFKALAKRYAAFSYEKDGLLIHIAAAPRDLFEEGLMLSHCVGTYVASHAKGNRCIFLIRHASSPDKSFFTLELDMNDLHVIQNRGFKNCARTPEVEAFETAWLDYIHQNQMKKGA